LRIFALAFVSRTAFRDSQAKINSFYKDGEDGSYLEVFEPAELLKGLIDELMECLSLSFVDIDESRVYSASPLYE
jgi:hypothetical protein